MTNQLTQKEIKQAVKVGGALGNVTSVGQWYKLGHFESDEEAQGAFKLAYQQALDGMGKSIRQWMGLTEEEFNNWYRNDALPARSRLDSDNSRLYSTLK